MPGWDGVVGGCSGEGVERKSKGNASWRNNNRCVFGGLSPQLMWGSFRKAGGFSCLSFFTSCIFTSHPVGGKTKSSDLIMKFLSDLDTLPGLLTAFLISTLHNISTWVSTCCVAYSMWASIYISAFLHFNILSSPPQQWLHSVDDVSQVKGQRHARVIHTPEGSVHGGLLRG